MDPAECRVERTWLGAYLIDPEASLPVRHVHHLV